MRRIALLLVGMLLSACVLADERTDAPAAHALSMQSYLADDPCFPREDWARVHLARKEYLPVYAAPLDDAYRAARGKAEVCLSEPFSVLASTQDGAWLLIEYEIDAQSRRIGYIQTPQDVDVTALDVQVLRSMPKDMEITAQTFVTDDPYHSRRELERLQRGETITCLGWTDAHYAYAQMEIDGKDAYGFVPMKALDIPKAPRLRKAEEMLRGVWQFAGGSEMFNYGIVMDGRGGFIDCGMSMELDGSLTGRYEVVPNDVPTDEFWNEEASYAFILRTQDGRVWRYVFDLLPADGAERTQDKLMFYRGMGGGNFGRMSGPKAQALLRQAEKRLSESK